jgi:NosR/NirI family nitrous oxide reductase transcriptional regulator
LARAARPGARVSAVATVVVLTAVFECSAETVTRKELARVLPAADRFVRSLDPFPHYLGYTAAERELVGVAFLTTEVVPDESWGYRDRIETLVGVDASGRITGVTVLSEFESPRYTKGLLSDGSWFLRQFEEKDAADGFVLRDDIDAITGATVTSSAICRSISVGLELMTQEVLDLQVRKDSAATHLFLQHVVWQVRFILLWIVVALATFAFYKKNVFLRYCILGMAIAYLGILKGGGFSMNDVLTLLSFRAPVFLNTLYWYSLVAIAIGSAIIAGRFYCGWLCPFGAILEVLYRVVPGEWTVSAAADSYLRVVKYVALASILLTALLLGSNTLASYLVGIVEPFATLFNLHGDVVSWAWLILMLMCSAVISRCYCKYFCPLGALFELMSAASSYLHLRRLSVRLPQDNCRGCRTAEKECQMGAIAYSEVARRPRIAGSQCFMCNTCAAACPVASGRP